MKTHSHVSRSQILCRRVLHWLLIAVALPLLWCGCAAPARTTASESSAFPPLPVLPPTALCGDAGGGRAFLRWNLQLEDERVIGWRVLATVNRQAEPGAAARQEPVDLTGHVKGTVDERGILREPWCVVDSLTNGSAYTFRVVGVLAGGGLTCVF